MRVLVASDAIGALTSLQAGRIIASGWSRAAVDVIALGEAGAGFAPAFAEQRGHTILELAFAWLLARPFIGSVISGASVPKQVEQNVKAVGWALTPTDMAELDRITR